MTSPSKLGTYALCLTFILGCAALADAQAAFTRVACEVVDESDQPLKKAVITATTTAYPSFKTSGKTNKRGKCVISVSDGTVPYTFKVELAGYEPVEVEVLPEVGKVIKRIFKLSLAGQPGASGAVMTAEELEKTRLGSKHVLLYNEGVETQKTGDLAGALAKFRASVEHEPGFAPSHTAIAIISLEQGSYQEAAEAAEKAISLDSEDYQALRLRWDAYRQLGDEKKADDAAKELRKAGDAVEVANRVFHEGVAAFNRGEIDNAKVSFRQALELDPELVEAYVNLAQIYNRDGNAQLAAEMAEETLKRNPNSMIALKVRYDARSRLGDSEAAKEALAQLIVADPEWAGVELYNHAQELFNSNQVPAATSVLQELLAAQPDHPAAHYLMGLCLNNANDLKNAKIHFERFLELAPDHQMAPTAREILKYIQ
jgi:tetratricopeptide (TPR) repeat protein